MARDKTRLKVFHLANELAVTVYKASRAIPAADRDIQRQLRRSAVSAPANIVEGCGRRSDAEYARFLDIALGSASEADYLLDLCHELRLLPPASYQDCKNRNSQLLRGLQKLLEAVERFRQ